MYYWASMQFDMLKKHVHSASNRHHFCILLHGHRCIKSFLMNKRKHTNNIDFNYSDMRKYDVYQFKCGHLRQKVNFRKNNY